MAQQFYYPTTPNVEAEAFRLLVLYDHKIGIVEWTANEAAIAAELATLSGAVDGLAAAMNELNKTIIRIQCEFCEHGL